MTARTIGIRIEAVDVLFFRDGRPFGESTRASGGQPFPQTLAGAVTTALLRETGGEFQKPADLRPGVSIEESIVDSFGESARWVARLKFRGPWPAKITNASRAIDDVYVPMPVNVFEEKPKDGAAPSFFRADPLSAGIDPPGWKDSNPSFPRPLWVREMRDGKRAAGYLNKAGLKDYLAGGVPGKEGVTQFTELFEHDHRTGIGINPETLAADEGKIYAIQYLAPKIDSKKKFTIGWYAEVILPEGAPSDALNRERVVHFGGEGRRARIAAVDRFSWPEPQAGERVAYLLTTPAFFGADRRPQDPNNCIVAAAMARPVAVSGWDLARGGPKPTRFGADAGSVFFAAPALADNFESFTNDPNDARLGWGAYLKGVWNHV